MRAKQIASVVLAAWTFSVATGARAQPAADAAHPKPAIAPSGVSAMVALALENNLELRAAATDLDAARARLSADSRFLRDNPEVTTSAGPRWNDQGDSADWSIGVVQRVEIAGQRGARRDVADAALRAAEARYRELSSALAADVREAYGAVVAATALARLADEDRALAHDSLAAAEERYRAGNASLIEENTARIELGRASASAAEAAATRETAVASLRLLAGLPADEPVAVREEATATSFCDQSLETLVATARARRSDLAAAVADVEQAEAERTLAARQAVSSPSFGIAYEQEEDDEIVRATVSIPLPIFDRNQAARGVAAAQVSRARLALQNYERRIESDVRRGLAECQSTGAALEAFRNQAMRAAESNLGLAQEGYRAGKLGYLELVLIRRNALEARRSAIESTRRQTAADARLGRAVGSPDGRRLH